MEKEIPLIKVSRNCSVFKISFPAQYHKQINLEIMTGMNAFPSFPLGFEWGGITLF